VTIRYYHGLPLGMLLGAIVDEQQPPQGVTPLVRPDPIGLRLEIEAGHSGTLYLRINESPAEWEDNAGELVVSVRKAT
jgi:hypothetical protein